MGISEKESQGQLEMKFSMAKKVTVDRSEWAIAMIPRGGEAGLRREAGGTENSNQKVSKTFA